MVSTVAGGLETPDFLELRKNSTRTQADSSESGPRSLYKVVPERQTSVRGLMGSERAYDVAAVSSGSSVPVLGDERGKKVRTTSLSAISVLIQFTLHSVSLTAWTCRWTHRNLRACPNLSSAGAMMLIREATLTSRALRIGRTFRTWSRLRWRRKSKKWSEMGRRARSSSSDGFLLHILFRFICLIACCRYNARCVMMTPKSPKQQRRTLMEGHGRRDRLQRFTVAPVHAFILYPTSWVALRSALKQIQPSRLLLCQVPA